MDLATVVEASVDGVALSGLWNYRFASPLFEFTSPGPDVALWPEYAGTHQAVSEG